MRPLTEEETKTFFEKLANIGRNIKLLIDRPDGDYCFRLHNERVYYLSAALLLTASSFPRDSLVHAGCCFGKFTKSRQFRLHVTCLDYLHQHARHKLWLRANGEMSFLYGNHVLKAHVGRLTEAAPQYAGVVLVTMADVPLGFGVMAMSTADCRKADSTAVVAFHQADVGEYLRTEQEL